MSSKNAANGRHAIEMTEEIETTEEIGVTEEIEMTEEIEATGEAEAAVILLYDVHSVAKAIINDFIIHLSKTLSDTRQGLNGKDSILFFALREYVK
jgi:hypothetical protein